MSSSPHRSPTAPALRTAAPLALAAALSALAGAPAVAAPRPPAASGGDSAAPAFAERDAEPILFLLAPDAVRRPRSVPAEAVVYLPGPPDRSARLLRLAVTHAGRALVERELDLELVADPRFGRAAALVELLPEELAGHRGARRFAPPEASPIAAADVRDHLRELRDLVAELRRKDAEGVGPARAGIDLRLPLDRLAADGWRVGEELELRLALEVEEAGERRTVVAPHLIRRLARRPPPPASLVREAGVVSVHAGDLHVHSCHGEALDACPPSEDCAAESLQLFGSFTYAELEEQFRALGVDWFAATDHSYCINSDAEYQAIIDEIAAVTDPTFVAFPDTELSSDEAGPQRGDDLGDLLCLGLTPQNHMGAHGITSRKRGGGDGFLGYCDGIFSDVLEGFEANVSAIRAEGGYPVVNHPTASSWAWNSFEALEGIEADGVHGVEIWNGAEQAGQDGDVGRWVEWLLAGRLLYAYSGSDTHDAAFDAGFNHVLLTAPFGEASLRTAIEGGRVYVSNGPLLALTVRAGTRSLLMGDRVALPADPPPAPGVEVRAHYDLGVDRGAVTLYRGAVGEAGEAVLCASGALTGSGVFACGDELTTGATSWYRAYVEVSGAPRTAYSNPVFFVPGE